MRTRNIVIIIVAGCTVILLSGVVSVWLLYSIATGGMFGYEAPQTPAQLKEARIVRRVRALP